MRSWNGGGSLDPFRRIAAFWELASLAGFSHQRPDFGISSVVVNGVDIPVVERVIQEGPFGSLVRFEKEFKDAPEPEPKVLLVAPMSGHFATLLAGTVKTLLREHDVHITDWKNARDVPVSEGAFGLDDFIDFLVSSIRAIGAGCHVIAVCQPTVAALVATAIMATDKDNCQPASLTLMAGPIDARVAPTKVNDLANDKPYQWFEEKMISAVPNSLSGAGRRVYPGFIQLSAFMSMNIERHMKSFMDLFKYRSSGENEKADAIRAFYEEYFAIMDLPAEFFLETIKEVFQDCSLARGEFRYRGVVVDPSRIKQTFLLTVEGERDDICSMGQTLAAQDLCSGLKPYMKSHHMQPGVGHYGVFNGRKWEGQIYPVVRNHIRSSM